jgi:hypothetical protein
LIKSKSSMNLLLLSAAVLFNAATAQESPIYLGAAANYAILAKTGISTVPSSAITGDIAVSPIADTAMTGFSLILESGGTVSTSVQIAGRAYAASYATPTPTHLTSAVSDKEAAYTDAAGRPNTDATRINLGGGNLGGAFGGATAPLTTGVYTFGTDISVGLDIHFSGSPLTSSSCRRLGTANTNVILERVVRWRRTSSGRSLERSRWVQVRI